MRQEANDLQHTKIARWLLSMEQYWRPSPRCVLASTQHKPQVMHLNTFACQRYSTDVGTIPELLHVEDAAGAQGRDPATPCLHLDIALARITQS
jgi:hypothetical protein